MGGIGVGEGGATVAGTVGVAVTGTGVGKGVGVEPEQAAIKAAKDGNNRAKNRIEAWRRLKSLGRRLKMLTSLLRTAVCRWMYPLAANGAPGWLKPSISSGLVILNNNRHNMTLRPAGDPTLDSPEHGSYIDAQSSKTDAFGEGI